MAVFPLSHVVLIAMSMCILPSLRRGRKRCFPGQFHSCAGDGMSVLISASIPLRVDTYECEWVMSDTMKPPCPVLLHRRSTRLALTVLLAPGLCRTSVDSRRCVGSADACLRVSVLSLRGRKAWEMLLNDYNILEGRLWPLLLLWVMIAPYVMHRIGRRSAV